MERKFVNLSVCCAIGALLAATPHAVAGDKGKSHRSGFSQSNGGGNSPSMKLHSNSSRKLMSSGMNGPSMNSSMSQTMSQSFTTKPPKNFARMSQSQNNPQTFQLYSGGKGSKGGKGHNNDGGGSGNITSNNLLANPSFNTNGRSRRTSTVDFTNKAKLADAFKNGKFQPIDSDNGIGNGTGPDIGSPSRKVKKFDSDKFSGKFSDIFHGGGKFPGKGNGKGNGPGIDPPFGDKFCDTPNKNKKCHDFPWWTIGVGGCYPNNWYSNNCYPNNCHNHYYNDCYPPIYNNYPPVTNVTVVNQQPLEPPIQPVPAQQALVDGVDLELMDLRLVDGGDATKNLGPRYRITFRNRGTVPAGNFQVMLLASSDGTPKPGLPSGSAEIAGLASGQLLSADVRLTMTADLPTMGSLIVAIDSATQVVESEERNNVAVLDRTKITAADLAALPLQ